MAPPPSRRRGLAIPPADLWTSVGLRTAAKAVVPDADGTVGGVEFDTGANVNPDLINIQTKIPAGAVSADGKLFGRLSATGP